MDPNDHLSIAVGLSGMSVFVLCFFMAMSFSTGGPGMALKKKSKKRKKRNMYNGLKKEPTAFSSCDSESIHGALKFVLRIYELGILVALLILLLICYGYCYS